MPRRKQQNPQPVKLDSENGIGINTSATVTFEGDCLLNQDLIFPDPGSDSKIIGLEKFSADITFPGFALRDDENSSFSHLSMESDSGENERDEGTSRPSFPPYLPCRGCAQHLSEPLGSGMDLVGAYCMRCCKGDPSGRPDRAQQASNSQHGLDESRAGGSGGEDESLKPHSCMLCGFSSRYTNHVKRHMKTHNGEKPYRCPLCSYASAQLVNLQRHLRIHTGEKPYKCDHCSFACSSLGNLKRHQRMHTVRSPTQNAHQQASGHALRRLGTGPKLRGDAPNASSEAAQSESSLNVSGDARYLHAFSGLKTGQQRSSSRTLALAPGTGQGPGHGPGQGTAPPAALPPLLFPFTCRLCGMALDDEDGSSAQICAKCTLEMLTKDASGAASERSDKVYTCAACPFLTHYPNHLARHMKTHSGEKPYKCPQCDYASAHFDNLKRHHRVHTGEKPYKCHLCDYACGNLANLKRHQRVHSGAKPFQCAICSYSCNQSMNLKRHMLRHTGEKPHKCQQCGYTTGHWDNYKRHQKKHGLPTDGWVKVPMHANEEEVENDEV